MGCVDNLLIDKIFVNCGTGRCPLTKEELLMQLGGFEETLEIHGIHFSLINLIKCHEEMENHTGGKYERG